MTTSTKTGLTARIPAAGLCLAMVATLLVGASALAPTATAATSRAISVAVTPSVTAVRGLVVFTGKLTRSPARTPVQVQRKFGSSWVRVASGSTTRTGAYRITAVAPSDIGVYAYRTYAPRKGSLAAAASKVVKVTALRKVTVNVKARPALVAAGGLSTISGTVRPFVAGTRVVIQKQVGASWTGVGSTTVSSRGGFARSVRTYYPTTYRAYVVRARSNAPAYSIGVRVDATPVIGTTALPAGNVGKVYSFALYSVGRPGGTWSASALPPGLSFNTSTGAITGTPTEVGTTQVTFGFTRTGGATAPAKTLPLTINPPLAPVIKTDPLPEADLGKAYSHQLLAVGAPAGTWSTSPLPAGLSLDPGTGVISGTPQPAGLGDTPITVNFTQASTGAAATPVELTLTVRMPTIKTETITEPEFLQPYSAQIQLSGVVPGTWSLSNAPAGYSIDQTGKITNGLVLSVPASLTVVFTISGAPDGTPALTRTYTFS